MGQAWAKVDGNSLQADRSGAQCGEGQGTFYRKRKSAGRVHPSPLRYDSGQFRPTLSHVWPIWGQIRGNGPSLAESDHRPNLAEIVPKLAQCGQFGGRPNLAWIRRMLADVPGADAPEPTTEVEPGRRQDVSQSGVRCPAGAVHEMPSCHTICDCARKKERGQKRSEARKHSWTGPPAPSLCARRPPLLRALSKTSSSAGAPLSSALHVVTPVRTENASGGVFSAPVPLGDAVARVRAWRARGLHRTPPHRIPPLGNVHGKIHPGLLPGQMSLPPINNLADPFLKTGDMPPLMYQGSVMFLGLPKIARSQRFSCPHTLRQWG